MSQSFLQYFRCPERYSAFNSAGQLSGASGFFEFGENTLGYGRYAGCDPSELPTGRLPDARAAVLCADGVPCLPFDLDEIIENLRFERYTEEEQYGSSKDGLLSAIYYAFRPFLPVKVRRHLQRIYLGDWSKIKFPRWPIDHSVDSILRGCLRFALRTQNVEKIPFIWFWPDGAPSCAIMTHDVETAAGRDYCATLMDINQSFGIPASFQVVPEERYAVSESYLDSIRRRGFEVNVQDLNHDGRLYHDRDEFVRRVAKINEYGRTFKAEGFRSAVLYRRQEWYSDLEFAYDMSVPSSGHLEPQRGGCCTVMPYFIGRVLELPVTTTQDYSLFNYLRSYSIDLWKKQIDLIHKQNGLISFIVHPDYIDEKRERKTYESLLAHLSNLRSAYKIWIPTPVEVNSWWRQRENMSLVEEDGQWKVQGPGSERARVAYAFEANGKLEFSLADGKTADKVSATATLTTF
jgi:hypothetical protein